MKDVTFTSPVREHPQAPFPTKEVLAHRSLPKTPQMKGMDATLMLLLDFVRSRLAVYNNKRLQHNNYEHIPYTRAIENIISAITDLNKHFH